MDANYHHIGVVTHFFDRIQVAVVLLENELYLDDWILVYGPRTQIRQQVLSMQVNHQPIDKAEPGDEVAIKINDVAREGDDIYLILDEQPGSTD
jgi:translation elongation factor EF-1alpha